MGEAEKGPARPTLPESTETVAVRDDQLVMVRGGLLLRAEDGPLRGWDASVGGGRLVLGSSQRLPSPLDDATVSRRHAVVERCEDGYFVVRDLGSLNGTFVDDVRVVTAPISGGQRLRLGTVVLSVDVSEELEVVPLSDRAGFGGLVGRSPPMRALFAELEQLSGFAIPVVLIGETGTGKELCARALHEEGTRGAGPFVVFDCAAAAATLAEAELFGHCRGAYTGAVDARAGVFEVAHRGTLFLDELGELPPPLQGKLLRAVERGEFRRVGEDRVRRVDVRIVSATNRDLEQMVAAGTFREDLYHRLCGAVVRIPALRERVEDIPLLATIIARRLLDDADADAESLFGPEVRRAMRRHPWPGNVRELRNWVARAALAGGAGGEELEATESADTPPAVDSRTPYHEARAAWIMWFEHRYATELLDRHGGNFSRAAQEAGLDRRSLHRLVQRIGWRG